MLARPHRSRCPAATVDIVGTGGDRSTPSTSPRWPRSSSPVPEPRSSSTATGPRRRRAAPPTCSRSSGSGWTSRPTQVGRGGRARPASPSASRRCSTRRCGTRPRRARELGVADAVQLPRPADQPGPAAGRRRSACADARMAPRHGRRASPGAAHGAGLPRRRRARRADDHDDLDTVWVVARRRGPAVESLDPRDAGGRAGAPARSCAAGTRAHNAAVVARGLLAGEAGAGARGRRCSTRRPRSWRWTDRSRRTTRRLDESLAAGAGRARRGAGQRGGGRRAGRGGSPRPSDVGLTATAARPGSMPGELPQCELVRSALEPEGEGGLEVVPGVRAERDVGLGAQDAVTLFSRPAMTSARSSWSRTRTIAMRSTSPATE